MGAERKDAIEDRVGDHGLRPAGQGLGPAPPVDEQDLVVVRVEADALAAHVVGHQQVDSLVAELRDGVRGDVAGLGGEADDERRAAPGRDLLEDVGVRAEVDREPLLAGADLRRGRVGRPIVGHRRGLDHDRRLAEMLQDRLAHVLRGLHGDEHGAGRRGDRGRPRDQHHGGAAPEGRRRDRVPHLPRGAVRDVPDGINGLARGSGADQQVLAGQVRDGSEEPPHGLDDVLDLGQSPLAGQAGRERARVRLEDDRTARPERVHVGPDGRVLPHAPVHGGREQQGAPRGQQ